MTLASTSVDFERNLALRVRKALCEDGYPQLSEVVCEAKGTTVFLKGQLPSFYFKQVAQTIAAKTQGVMRVINRIEVEPLS